MILQNLLYQALEEMFSLSSVSFFQHWGTHCSTSFSSGVILPNEFKPTLLLASPQS